MSVPRITLLPWGDVIEDFLDAAGLSLDELRDELTGGWLFGYVDALQRAGVETAIVCMTARVERPVRTHHRPTGAELHLLPASRTYRMLRRRGRSSGLARELAPYLATPLARTLRELRRSGCSAVLCQEYEYPRFDVCVALGALARLPVYATFQGGDAQSYRLERRLRPRTLRAARGVVIASATEAERVRRRYGLPPERIARIFNPLDVAQWSPHDRAVARAELGIGEASRVVAWHGRVDVHLKGLDVLVEAWRRLRAGGGDDLRLLLVGGGDGADELRRLLDDGDVPGVLWVDEYVLDRERLRRHLSAADVYAFPSRREGFPVAPVEAMACSLPVVAADVSGVGDILDGGERSGGILVPSGDAHALANGLGRLLENEPLRTELGRRARRRAEEAFSPAAVGRQLRGFLLGR